jgi:hypothetical protein
MTELFVHICGWAGMALIVGAYYLVSDKKLDPAGRMYQWLNLVGSAGVGVNVFYQKAWPAFTLEIVWGAIAIGTLVRYKKSKEDTRKSQ